MSNFFSFQLWMVFMVVIIQGFSQNRKGQCVIEKRVKLALKSLNRSSVVEVANCILGQGPCDAVGNEVKPKVREAICSQPCSRRSQCTCDQIQVIEVMHDFRTY